MKQSSKILIWATVFLIFLSVFATFYEVVILQDFEIVVAEE